MLLDRIAFHLPVTTLPLIFVFCNFWYIACALQDPLAPSRPRKKKRGSTAVGIPHGSSLPLHICKTRSVLAGNRQRSEAATRHRLSQGSPGRSKQCKARSVLAGNRQRSKARSVSPKRSKQCKAHRSRRAMANIHSLRFSARSNEAMRRLFPARGKMTGVRHRSFCYVGKTWISRSVSFCPLHVFSSEHFCRLQFSFFF